MRFGYIGKKQEIIGNHYFAETLTVTHTKVVSDKSIYYNDLVYWSDRGKASRNLASNKSTFHMLPSQDHKCNICGLKFLSGDVIEIDHIVPKSSGSANHYGNLQAFQWSLP